MFSGMRNIPRKLAACIAVGVYGAVALLGQSLHWLSAEDHHHHGPSAVHSHVHVSGHGHCHDRRNHQHAIDVGDETSSDTLFGAHSIDGACHSDDCEICAFLSQIKSERPQVAVADICQQVFTEVTATYQQSYSPIFLGSHSPRGPPHSIA
jgi:hypothetical protein